MVVVDSSVLIHLNRVGRLRLLKEFFKEIKITSEIYNEIKTDIGFSEIERGYGKWILVKDYENGSEKLSKLENIEEADASIILLAERQQDILLSNDFMLLMVAKSKNIECWWLTTFILKCLKKGLIRKNETRDILFNLIKNGLRLSNEVYAAILYEIERL